MNSSALIAPELDELMFLNTPVAIFLSIEIFNLATIAVSSSIVRYPSIFKSKSSNNLATAYSLFLYAADRV